MRREVLFRQSACALQVANPDFFLKTLPLFDAGDDVGMVLSPQCFNNVSPRADIFNHGNIQFWEYAQRGYDALGFISCTGALARSARLPPALHAIQALPCPGPWPPYPLQFRIPSADSLLLFSALAELRRDFFAWLQAPTS